jgi:hypothetical protein
MVKTGGRIFATPGEQLLLPQQVQIAALHQLQAGADQANGPVTQIIRFPAATYGNVCVAEQSRRDDAIGRAGKACIERTKCKTKAVSSAPRQPIRRARAPSAGNETPETQCWIGAYAEISIERDEDRGGQVTVRAADEHRGQAVMPVIDEPVFASTARRANAGVSIPIRPAFLKVSDAGATRTAPGSRCTSHTTRALSARSAGLIGKS